MADVEQNIHLSATGGDEAAAAINKTTSAFKGVGGEHDALVSKFSHKFQHVGLMLFVGEALRASGAGSETRIVVSTLNMAMTALAGSFGAAAAPIFLVGTALTAVVGLTAKIINHHKDEAETLGKLVSEDEKQVKVLTDSITTLEEYQRIMGKLPQTTMDVLAAKKELREFEAQEEIATLHKQIDVLGKLMAEEEKAIESEKKFAETKNQHNIITAAASVVTGNYTAATGGLIIKYTDWNAKIHDTTKSLLEHKTQAAEAADKLRLLGDKNYQTYKEMADGAKKATEEDAKMEKARLTAFNHINKGLGELQAKENEYYTEAEVKSADTFNKKNQAAELWYIRQKSILDKMYADEVQYSIMSLTNITDLNAKVKELTEAHHKALEALQTNHQTKIDTLNKQIWTNFKDQVKDAMNAFTQETGQAFAKMMVEGKDFGKSMQEVFKNMAERFIAYVVEMTIKWLAFLALKAATGGATGFFMAEGGTMLVDKPTLFVAGEAGPEIASFTPLSKLSSGNTHEGGGSRSGNSTVNINVGGVSNSISGVNNPDAIADVIGEKIISRIRGRGELDFLRKG
jgi:hypothetical protein